MNLRTRILVFAGLTLACLITGIYFLSSKLLMHTYAELESQDAQRNLDRASLAYAQLNADLHVKTVDWAQWNDAYQFLKDHNDSFIKSNMIENSISNMELDLVMYLDTKGRIFSATPVKRLKGVRQPLPDSGG